MIEKNVKQILQKFKDYLPWMMIFLGAIILLPLIVRIFNRGFNFEILGIIIIGGACLAFGVFLLKNDQLINK